MSETLRPLAERFESRLTIDGQSECWVWTGAKNLHGYGKISRAGKLELAHRVSYEMFVGTIPDGLHIDHLCRNKSCVNPRHLEAVTCRENIRRGIGPTSVNMRKTHCVREHPLSGKNITIRPNRKRRCRACEQFYSRQKTAARILAKHKETT